MTAQTTMPAPGPASSEDERTRYVAALIDGMEGWCTPLKGRVLYDLARAPGCELAVEIGIYGGKSLVPVARGFADKGSGRIYGVEPWDNAVAVETVTNEGNDQWWLEVDLLGIKRSFLRRISDLGLEKHVKILEVPSDSALLIFQTARFAGKIDLVHVDGAHSVEQSTLDCAYWLRLLKPGGHLVLDDIDWGTVDTAHRFLEQAADRVFISESAENGYFVVFRKRGGPQP